MQNKFLLLYTPPMGHSFKEELENDIIPTLIM